MDLLWQLGWTSAEVKDFLWARHFDLSFLVHRMHRICELNALDILLSSLPNHKRESQHHFQKTKKNQKKWCQGSTATRRNLPASSNLHDTDSFNPPPVCGGGEDTSKFSKEN
jgi:hypothetical protein